MFHKLIETDILPHNYFLSDLSVHFLFQKPFALKTQKDLKSINISILNLIENGTKFLILCLRKIFNVNIAMKINNNYTKRNTPLE